MVSSGANQTIFFCRSMRALAAMSSGIGRTHCLYSSGSSLILQQTAPHLCESSLLESA